MIKVITDENAMVLYSFKLLLMFSKERARPDTNIARKVRTELIPISFTNWPGWGKIIDNTKMHIMIKVNVYFEAGLLDFN